MKKDVEARLRAIHEDFFIDSPEALLLREDPVKFFSGEMCKSGEKAMNQLTKSHSIAGIVVREQEEAITEDLEDRFAQRPYGPLFIEEIEAKNTFTVGDVVYNEDGTLRARYVGGEPKIEVCEIVETREDGKTRCVDCKHRHPAVWGGTSEKPNGKGGCKLHSKFRTFNDTIFWTCDKFEEKEE